MARPTPALQAVVAVLALVLSAHHVNCCRPLRNTQGEDLDRRLSLLWRQTDLELIWECLCWTFGMPRAVKCFSNHCTLMQPAAGTSRVLLQGRPSPSPSSLVG